MGLIGLCGCLELPDFPSASLIDAPRVLAIVAEPPEVTPGVSADLSLLVVGTDQFDVKWQACGTFDPLFGGQQFGETSEGDCSDESALMLAVGPNFHISGQAVQQIFDNADLAESVLGGRLPPELVEQIRTTVGIPLLVEAAIETQGRTLRAVKRILLSENPEPHHNPPPPEFRFGGTPVHADGQTPWSCSPLDTSMLSVAPGSDTEIAPTTVDGEESWLESYRVITAQGELVERTERAFYSWFAAGGSFDRRLTRSPLRNQIWTSPRRPGCYRLWLVVRDGHGGASACGWDVGVGDEADWPDDLRCAPP